MAIMKSVKIFDGQVLSASATATSAPIEIGKANALAIHHNETSGTGTVTYTYSLSPSKNGTFITPASPVTIGSGITVDDVLDFAPEAAGWIKITATEAGGAQAITFTSVLMIQEL